MGMDKTQKGPAGPVHVPRGGHKDRPLCGARTRKGVPCVRRVAPGRLRCRNHGGLSTGPRTAEGRGRALGNLRRGEAHTSRVGNDVTSSSGCQPNGLEKSQMDQYVIG